MAMLTIRSFQTVKAGNRPEECEDAYRIRLAQEGPSTLAICDGASESAFARSWARILAEALVTRPIDPDRLDDTALAEWLEPCISQWNGVVPWGRLPWHGVNKTRAGSLATFLGLTIDWAAGNPDALAWRAIAVGDCCMFVVRGNDLGVAFPLEESSQFNSTPALICSNRANNGAAWSCVSHLEGECMPGDVILLASDALASWALREHEAGGKPWETLLLLDSEEQWTEWVRVKRQERQMRNDDTTMVTVKVQ